jgi:hypothetical protein
VSDLLTEIRAEFDRLADRDRALGQPSLRRQLGADRIAAPAHTPPKK